MLKKNEHLRMQCYKYILKLIEQMLIRETFTLINKFTSYLEVI